MATKIHPTALIEDNVAIGGGSAIWDNVHIRHGAKIGTDCIVGEKSYVAYDVVIGDRVKINGHIFKIFLFLFKIYLHISFVLIIKSEYFFNP